MHGLILNEMKKYVVARMGDESWSTLMRESGNEQTTYLATSTYPDRDVVNLVCAASKVTGKTVPVILEDFGEFLVPGLIKIFGARIDERWKALDLIEYTEDVMHRAVRLHNPGATPPELRCVRSAPDQVVITYSSPRRMCGIAKGIIKGVSKHYGETLQVREPLCMHNGASNCIIKVNKAPKLKSMIFSS